MPVGTGSELKRDEMEKMRNHGLIVSNTDEVGSRREVVVGRREKF